MAEQHPSPTTVELDAYALAELRNAAMERLAESMRFAASDLDLLATTNQVDPAELENAQDARRMVERDLGVLDRLGWPQVPDRSGVVELNGRR